MEPGHEDIRIAIGEDIYLLQVYQHKDGSSELAEDFFDTYWHLLSFADFDYDTRTYPMTGERFDSFVHRYIPAFLYELRYCPLYEGCTFSLEVRNLRTGETEIIEEAY